VSPDDIAVIGDDWLTDGTGCVAGATVVDVATVETGDAGTGIDADVDAGVDLVLVAVADGIGRDAAVAVWAVSGRRGSAAWRGSCALWAVGGIAFAVAGSAGAGAADSIRACAAAFAVSGCT
jgi:hypothetical protein